MCAAIGLLVDAIDIDDADRLDALGQEIDPRANQVGYLERLRAGQKPNRDRPSLLEQFIGALLNGGQTVLRQVGQQKVHARAVGIHLAAGHGGAVELKDHAAHGVQGGVVAHERVAPLPIDIALHARADLRRRALEAMHDGRPLFAHLDDRDRAAVPGEPAHVMRLPTAGGVKRRPVEHDPAFGIDFDHCRVERADIRVVGVQQLGFRHVQDGSRSRRNTPVAARMLARRASPA